MAHQATLQTGQILHVEQQGEQTLIRVQREGQAQRTSLQTGPWQAAPRLYRTALADVLELRVQAPIFYAVQDGQLQSLDTAPELAGAEQTEFAQVPDEGAEGGIKPMEGMKPL